VPGDATILHADVDSFYASVEQRDDPRLRGRPVIVGGGVVLAASYEAKAYGIRTPMGETLARHLCPHAVVVRPRMDAYSYASKALFEVFDDTTPFVEGISIDEAFLDVGGLRRISGTPTEIARRLREDVREKVGLPITVGVARTKFLAKVASTVAKPDGFLVVPPEAEPEFLHPLPVEALWGVGQVTGTKLRDRGITTVAQVATGRRSVARADARDGCRTPFARAGSQSGSPRRTGGTAPSLNGVAARARTQAQITGIARHRPRRDRRPASAEAPNGAPSVSDDRSSASVRRLFACDSIAHVAGGDCRHADDPPHRERSPRRRHADDQGSGDHADRRDV
jgi:DNA polymerase IV